MGRLRKFLALPSGERGPILQAAFFLWGIRVGLWIFPFQAFCRFLDRLFPSPDRPSADAPSAETLARAVLTASRHLPFTRNCLVRALATRLLLRRTGYSARLRIGVRRDPSVSLEAHAWVEERGRILLEGTAPARYSAFPPFQW